MSTCGVTYSNGVVYFILRVILDTCFSIITNRNTVYRICFSIVTNCYRVITIMSSTITNCYTLSSIGGSLGTNGNSVRKRLLISSCTLYNSCTLTDSNRTSSISLGISTSVICCIRCAIIIIFRSWICRTDSNRLITCCQCRVPHSQASFTLCRCSRTDSCRILFASIGLSHHSQGVKTFCFSSRTDSNSADFFRLSIMA